MRIVIEKYRDAYWEGIVARRRRFKWWLFALGMLAGVVLWLV